MSLHAVKSWHWFQLLLFASAGVLWHFSGVSLWEPRNFYIPCMWWFILGYICLQVVFRWVVCRPIFPFSCLWPVWLACRCDSFVPTNCHCDTYHTCSSLLSFLITVKVEYARRFFQRSTVLPSFPIWDLGVKRNMTWREIYQCKEEAVDLSPPDCTNLSNVTITISQSVSSMSDSDGDHKIIWTRATQYSRAQRLNEVLLTFHWSSSAYLKYNESSTNLSYRSLIRQFDEYLWYAFRFMTCYDVLLSSTRYHFDCVLFFLIHIAVMYYRLSGAVIGIRMLSAIFRFTVRSSTIDYWRRKLLRGLIALFTLRSCTTLLGDITWLIAVIALRHCCCVLSRSSLSRTHLPLCVIRLTIIWTILQFFHATIYSNSLFYEILLQFPSCRLLLQRTYRCSRECILLTGCAWGNQYGNFHFLFHCRT